MKMLGLLTDGDGRLHVVVTRAPDQLRRALSSETGCARLHYVAIPPGGAAPLAAALERQLGERRLAPGVYDVSPAEAIRRIHALLLAERASCWWRRCRRGLRRLAAAAMA
jgi:hypothetical protein